MDCVPSLCKLFSKFRTYDAATTICRVNRDAYVHKISEQYAVSGQQ